MLVDEKADPLDFYPITLTQISTLGPIHNYAPLADVKRFPRAEGDVECPIFRFYFDGLIVHFHRPINDAAFYNDLGSLLVGAGEKLTMSTVTFEASLQNQLGYTAIYESVSQWGLRPHLK